MYWGGSWDVVGVLGQRVHQGQGRRGAPAPGRAGEATIIHGLANVISAKTEHPEEAWQFVKFLGSERAAEIQASERRPIPAYKGTQGAWVSAHPRIQAAGPSSTRWRTPCRTRCPSNTAAWNDGGAQLPRQGLDRRGAGRGGRQRSADGDERPARQGVDMTLMTGSDAARAKRDATPGRAPPRGGRGAGGRSRRCGATLFIAPTGLGLAVFYLWPICGPRTSRFTEWGVVRRPHLDGLDNYRRLLQRPGGSAGAASTR